MAVLKLETGEHSVRLVHLLAFGEQLLDQYIHTVNELVVDIVAELIRMKWSLGESRGRHSSLDTCRVGCITKYVYLCSVNAKYKEAVE